MAKLNTTAQLIREFERVLSQPELPTDAARTDDYNAELVRRYQTGQYLTKADKAEAETLIAVQKRSA